MLQFPHAGFPATITALRCPPPPPTPVTRQGAPAPTRSVAATPADMDPKTSPTEVKPLYTTRSSTSPSPSTTSSSVAFGSRSRLGSRFARARAPPSLAGARAAPGRGMGGAAAISRRTCHRRCTASGPSGAPNRHFLAPGCRQSRAAAVPRGPLVGRRYSSPRPQRRAWLHDRRGPLGPAGDAPARAVRPAGRHAEPAVRRSEAGSLTAARATRWPRTPTPAQGLRPAVRHEPPAAAVSGESLAAVTGHASSHSQRLTIARAGAAACLRPCAARVTFIVGPPFYRPWHSHRLGPWPPCAPVSHRGGQPRRQRRAPRRSVESATGHALLVKNLRAAQEGLAPCCNSCGITTSPAAVKPTAAGRWRMSRASAALARRTSRRCPSPTGSASRWAAEYPSASTLRSLCGALPPARQDVEQGARTRLGRPRCGRPGADPVRYRGVRIGEATNPGPPNSTPRNPCSMPHSPHSGRPPTPTTWPPGPGLATREPPCAGPTPLGAPPRCVSETLSSAPACRAPLNLPGRSDATSRKMGQSGAALGTGLKNIALARKQRCPDDGRPTGPYPRAAVAVAAAPPPGPARRAGSGPRRRLAASRGRLALPDGS